MLFVLSVTAIVVCLVTLPYYQPHYKVPTLVTVVTTLHTYFDFSKKNTTGKHPPWILSKPILVTFDRVITAGRQCRFMHTYIHIYIHIYIHTESNTAYRISPINAYTLQNWLNYYSPYKT